MTSMISREIQIWQLKYVNQAYISLEYQFQYMAETQSVNSKKKKKNETSQLLRRWYGRWVIRVSPDHR